MRFQLLTLFAITAIVAVGLAVFSPGLTHPESVVKILRQLNNIPPDADLRTVITTTLKPMRHADDCVETTTSKTYFVNVEENYFFLLEMDKTVNGLRFKHASIIQPTFDDEWEYVFPIREKNGLKWKTTKSPIGPYDHYPQSWGTGCSIKIIE